MICLEKRTIHTEIKNPLKNFEIDKQTIETRKDPLTGRVCRINVDRSKREKFKIEKDEFLEEVVKKTKKNCYFCGENIKTKTPEFVEFGRLRKGESILFPNLYPFSFKHAVVVISDRKHFIPLNKFKPKLLENAILNTINFFKKVYEKNKKVSYPSLNFNYLPPAGASILHPHFQVFLDEKPTSFTKLMIQKSLGYYKKKRKNFWEELIKTEKKLRERFIGETKFFAWIADFAPIRSNSVSGIIKGKISCITSMKKNEIKDLAFSLSLIFKKMWKIGIRSLNMSIFSSAINQDLSKHFRLNLKIIPRPSFKLGYTSDIGFSEIIHQEYVVDTLPEKTALMLKF